MSKPLVSICIDHELMPIVRELQARRQFSKFIQDCLRNHRVVIESESLEHEKEKITKQIIELQNKHKSIDLKLEEVKRIEDDKVQIMDLVLEYQSIINDLSKFKYLDGVEVSKWPKPIRDLHYRKLSILNTLKSEGYDLANLKGDRNIIN